jgi:tRNA(Ile)-lysidine synthase
MLVGDDESASTTGGKPAAEVGADGVDPLKGVMTRFERRLAAAWNPAEWCDTHTVVAVSGGADSVALLRAIAALKAQNGGKGALVVAHLDHGLRGDTAKDDCVWLTILSKWLGLPLEVGSADVAVLSAKQGDGLEAAARHARYEFLRQTAEGLGARYVATAHTADDQSETVLHRILRGTGLAGLTGIPSTRQLAESVTLVRPMLSLTRREVLDYLAELSQDYRTDATNSDTTFTRNRLRHELLPELRERFNPEVDAALVRLAAQASETQQALEFLAARLARECVTIRREHTLEPGAPNASAVGGVQIACSLLREQPDVLIREVCKLAWREANWPMQAMGFCEWHLLSRMVVSQQKQANFPASVRARREGDRLLLDRRSLS